MTTAVHKIRPTHLERQAFVYVRQSTPSQVQLNRESQEVQYRLVERARALGWGSAAVITIDEDLGLSGTSSEKRTGFQRLVAEVSLGKVGLVMGIDVSRLARNNRDWYHLLDLCSLFDTLIADSDGIYHPGDYNDRLLLGLKGTISEAELHVMRARMNAGLHNKAKKGELYTGIPIGFYLTSDNELVKDPDESIQASIQLLIQKFDELRNAKRVLQWFASNDVLFPRLKPPRRLSSPNEVLWERPVYTSIYNVLHNPMYAGAYFYGRTRSVRRGGLEGGMRSERLPMDQWEVLLPKHHEGYMTWEKFLQNQEILRGNRRMGGLDEKSRPGRGNALLQGLMRCGLCGRKMRTEYGAFGVPRYVCRVARDTMMDPSCQSLGALRPDAMVVEAFLEVVTPARVAATVEAIASLRRERESLRRHWQLQIEQASYEADRARRQYHQTEPENRLVARELERRWNERLQHLEEVRQQAEEACGAALEIEPETIQRLQGLGSNLRAVWKAISTTPEDRKQLLRTLIEEVVTTVDRKTGLVRMTIVWRGGQSTKLEARANRSGVHGHCTTEEALGLLRQLARTMPDEGIAEVLNKRGFFTGMGNAFNASRVQSLRRYHKTPAFDVAQEVATYNVAQAAEKLGVSTATIHRWLAAGWLRGVQLTPHAPWSIEITADDEARLRSTDSGQGLSLADLSEWLGLQRKVVLKKIQSGEIAARRVQDGRRSRWIVELPALQGQLTQHQMNLEYDS